MEEKYMVSDVLTSIKNGLSTYQIAIAECANMQLRQTLQQIRNNNEALQYETFKIAEDKGYYTPAKNADPADISTVKREFTK